MLEHIIATEKAIDRLAQFWPVIPVAFIVSVLATLLCKKAASRLGIVDKPDNNVKTHKNPTPYMGGVAIFAGILAGILVSFLFVPEKYGSVSVKAILGILAAGGFACAVGLLDDIFDIRPWQKILGQVAAALILICVGVRPDISAVLGPIPPLAEIIVQSVIVILFVLGATNSLNLLDGLDGLCAGVTAIMTAGMLVLAASMAAQYPDVDNTKAVFCLALLPSVLGFLIFNYHPARIFMGDAGSLLLGLNMAALMMLFAQKQPQYLLASIMIFGLPILDTAVAFARRILNKRPLFVSDRGHVYDQMMDRGMSLKKTVNFCYALSAVYCLAGLAVSRMPLLWALSVCAVVVIVSALVIWKKGYLKMEGLRGAKHEEQPSLTH